MVELEHLDHFDYILLIYYKMLGVSLNVMNHCLNVTKWCPIYKSLSVMLQSLFLSS